MAKSLQAKIERGIVVRRDVQPVRIPPDLLNIFVRENATITFKPGPGSVGVQAVSPAIMRKILQNAKVLESLEKNGLTFAIDATASE